MQSPPVYNTYAVDKKILYMYTISMTTIIDNLNWRYATKTFDVSKELDATELEQIVEAGRLAATAYGLQPFNIIVVTDMAEKQALVPHAYGQTHVADNGALVVLAARTDIDAAFISAYTALIETTRGLPVGTVDGFKDMMIGDLTNRTPEARLVWAQKQAYIALGTMMTAASKFHVDNHAIEGFDPAAFNEVLGLDAKHLHATVLLTLGHRADSDETQHYAKVRRSAADMIVQL